MRVLFLTDAGPDYLADLLFIGLSQVLGREQVVDHPLKPIYHLPERRVHYIPQIPAHSYREGDVVSLLRDRRFDLMILSSPRPGVTSVWDALRKQVSLPPAVLFDGEDDPVIRRETWHRSRAVLYFKREFKATDEGEGLARYRRLMRPITDGTQSTHLFPLQLSVALGQVPACGPMERVVDVSYAARVSHPRRKLAVDVLAGATGFRFEGGVYAETTDRQSKLMTGWRRLWTKLMGDPVIAVERRGVKLSPREYYELMARSKMALSVRGGGFDTLRYWEIPATKTVLLSEQPDIEIPNNFVHEQQALFFKPDLSDLVGLVRSYARDERLCAEIAQRGYEHLLRHHTCERRAEYVLETCRRII